MIRTLLLAAASAAVFLPFISHASTESTALGACTRAFAASIAAPGSIAPAFKLVRSNDPQSAIDNYYSGHEYTFSLQAHDPKSGLAVASATCTSDARGTQVALTPVPVNSRKTALAIRYTPYAKRG
jgi:hypothetical protein